MKTTITRITAFIALALVAASAAAQVDPQVITIPLSRPGEPVSLEIGMLSARIEVVGEDREDAEFSVSVEQGSRRIITPSGAKELPASAYSLEVDENDNHISIDTDWRMDKVIIVARIPRRADLELSTTNDGEIIVRNVTGSLQLENTNGPITATGISGAVIAESVNDTLDISFASIDAQSAMSFETINGDIMVAVPGATGAQLHIDSAQGEIYSDFEVDVQPTKPVIERRNDRGGVEVRMETVIVANINGGGPVIRLKTLNGDIHVKEAGN